MHPVLEVLFFISGFLQTTLLIRLLSWACGTGQTMISNPCTQQLIKCFRHITSITVIRAVMQGARVTQHIVTGSPNAAFQGIIFSQEHAGNANDKQT